jgi:2-phosphoglycerate kinase
MTAKRRQQWPIFGEDGLPYSKGITARALMAGGLAAEQAYELASLIEKDLQATGRPLELDRVQELAVGLLGEDAGGRAARRLRKVRELQEIDEPVILLIGGSTGTGKSTVATEAAYRLGITRVTSTDFVRQTMRAFFSHEFMPSIHYSSFEAGSALRSAEDAEDPMIVGFLDQTRNVLVGVRASIDRALQEGWSMVLEGVHVVPGMLPTTLENALVVQCVLAIDDETAHADHFWVRDVTSDGLRPVQKYLDRLSDIRRLQDYIVERARRTGVPVIENGDVEGAIGAVIELVLEAAADRMERV